MEVWTHYRTFMYGKFRLEKVHILYNGTGVWTEHNRIIRNKKRHSLKKWVLIFLHIFVYLCRIFVYYSFFFVRSKMGYIHPVFFDFRVSVWMGLYLPYFMPFCVYPDTTLHRFWPIFRSIYGNMGIISYILILHKISMRFIKNAKIYNEFTKNIL